MSEKTEKATAHKLKKAKEKGQVNKSNEVIIYVSLLSTLSIISVLWPKQISVLKSTMIQLFHFAGHFNYTSHNVTYLNHIISTELMSLWFPIAGIALITIILCTLVQTGFTWSTAALIPDFKRINPVSGFKKLYSISRLFEAAKCIFKLLFCFIFFWLILKNKLPSLEQIVLTQPTTHNAVLIKFLLNTSLQILLCLLLFAFIDKKFTHWNFHKEQKMSKQELKEEYRQKEGDPKIKNKIRQLQYQLRKKTAALKQVKNADVLITNPTHLAIALQYKRDTMPAPKVIYKAQDKMVAPVKEVAQKYGIPIIEHKMLARMLHYSTELNHYINKELFPLTAEVFRDLYRQGVTP